jgi:translation initiation factor IF-1
MSGGGECQVEVNVRWSECQVEQMSGGTECQVECQVNGMSGWSKYCRIRKKNVRIRVKMSVKIRSGRVDTPKVKRNI